MLSGSYIQDHRDNPADAHRGFWNTLDAGVAGNFFGSQRNFARVLARNATYTSIGHNLVFARQTQIGEIFPFHVAPGTIPNDEVPLPERFFGGGGVSMRGFGDNQAGPRDIGTTNELPMSGISTINCNKLDTSKPQYCPSGFPIGGDALFFNTFELRFPLLGPNISGVLFHDLGNIYTNFGNLSLAYHQPGNIVTQPNIHDFDYAAQAAGFGIRYRTPLGPVRVDLAYALNPPNYEGFGTSLTIQQLLKCNPNATPMNPNPGYCTPSAQRLSHFEFFFSIGQAF
jgi:outer membrane protein insertion porin family